MAFGIGKKKKSADGEAPVVEKKKKPAKVKREKAPKAPKAEKVAVKSTGGSPYRDFIYTMLVGGTAVALPLGFLALENFSAKGNPNFIFNGFFGGLAILLALLTLVAMVQEKANIPVTYSKPKPVPLIADPKASENESGTFETTTEEVSLYKDPLAGEAFPEPKGEIADIDFDDLTEE